MDGLVRNRAALGLVCGGCLLLAGCIPYVPVYYAYPTATATGPVRVEKGAEEVRAYRVDIHETQRSDGVLHEARQVLTPVPLVGNTVAGQAARGLDHGWIWNCIALVFTEHTHRGVVVRLYRPGYATVEITPEQKPG